MSRQATLSFPFITGPALQRTQAPLFGDGSVNWLMLTYTKKAFGKAFEKVDLPTCYSLKDKWRQFLQGIYFFGWKYKFILTYKNLLYLEYTILTYMVFLYFIYLYHTILMNLDSGFIVLLLGQPYITRFPCNIYGILETFQNTVSRIQGDSYSGLAVS